MRTGRDMDVDVRHFASVALVTTDHVPGFESVAHMGLVLACIPFWGSKYAEGIGNLKGQTNSNVAGAFEHRRRELLQRLANTARDIGADAVVCIRMTDREINDTWKELCAYGTAVQLRRNR